jgi:hypothetical protein
MPTDEIVRCGKCKLALDEDPSIRPDQRIPCPSCGSTARDFQVSISAGLVMRSKLRMKAKHPGANKAFVEEISGDDLHRETNKWMKLSRVYDRQNDRYEEVITDPVTGEVVHKCIEPLSEHRGHGSAKQKKVKD